MKMLYFCAHFTLYIGIHKKYITYFPPYDDGMYIYKKIRYANIFPLLFIIQTTYHKAFIIFNPQRFSLNYQTV